MMAYVHKKDFSTIHLLIRLKLHASVGKKYFLIKLYLKNLPLVECNKSFFIDEQNVILTHIRLHLNTASFCTLNK